MEEYEDIPIDEYIAMNAWRVSYISWVTDDIHTFRIMKAILLLIDPEISLTAFKNFLKHITQLSITYNVHPDDTYAIMNDIKEVIFGKYDIQQEEPP